MSSVKSLVALALSDGARPVAPSSFSVKTEEYPLSRRLYLYVPRPAHHPLAEELVHFALAADGQRAVSGAGFVDLRASDSDTDAAGNPCAAPQVQCPAEYARAVAHARRMAVDFRFDTARASLDSRGERDVNRLTATLRARHQTHVLLFGFSDGVGAASANVALSTQRARQVAAALTPEGIVVDDAVGFGAALPVASDRAEAGRERNRRVEVWLPEGG
jgi:phosphate transport system substrate-binding protein